MSLFFGSLKIISFSGKIILPVNCRPGFWSHLPTFPLSAVTYCPSPRSASNKQLRGVLQHFPPHSFVSGLQDLPPALGFLGGSLASCEQHSRFFSQMTKCHKCITVDNSDDETPGEARKGTSVGPKAPSHLLKCCTCFMDKEQLLLLELSVKASFLSAKVTINNRITLKNINGKYSSVYNSPSISSCELPASLKSTNLYDLEASHLCYMCMPHIYMF